ncbi:MAG: PEGA domain-containing protein [Myxococcota bacterium]
MHGRWAWLLAAALCATAAPALAQEGEPAASDGAREKFLEGQRAYQQGDYETAIARWSEAYELDPRPLILYNLSQAHERYGQLPEAAAALEKYLAEADAHDPNRETARARLASIRERLGRTGIRVADAPEGAEIFVDDASWGRAPRPDRIPLEPGSHRVVLKLEGYEDFRASVGVPAGQTVDVSAAMEPGVSAPASAEADAPGLGPWLVVGGGGALLLTGAITGGLALKKAGDAEFRDDGDADGAKTLGLLTDILLPVGAAAVAGGLLWYFLARPGDGGEEDSEGAEVSVEPWFGPQGGGADATVRF